MLLLLVYVDDILITGECEDDVQQVIKDVQAQFALKNLGPVKYFLGFEVRRSSAGLHLNQYKYARDLFYKTNIAAAKFCSTPMCFE